MDLFSFLDSLRKRPLHSRRFIALVSALTITGVISLTWFVFLFYGRESAPLLSGIPLESIQAPFDDLQESVQASLSSLKEISGEE